jgi:hypothetical protein
MSTASATNADPDRRQARSGPTTTSGLTRSPRHSNVEGRARGLSGATGVTPRVRRYEPFEPSSGAWVIPAGVCGRSGRLQGARPTRMAARSRATSLPPPTAIERCPLLSRLDDHQVRTRCGSRCSATVARPRSP